jgi:hypothetical protein
LESRPQIADPDDAREDANAVRDWLRRLPALVSDIEAKERAAILAEGRGEFGPVLPQAEHLQLVAALVRGYDAHRHGVLASAEQPRALARDGTSA